MRSIFLILCSLLMVACAQVKMGDPTEDARLKTFQAPEEDVAGVYIYRNETFGSAVKMNIDANGKHLGQTGPKTYLYKEFPEGEHTFISRTENDAELTLNLEGGMLYYIWQEVKMGVWMARSLLQQVDEETGQKGVLESKLALTE